jgi:CheY-like chemotaxis protein
VTGLPPRGRILVVDDDRAIREALTGILEQEGYEVAAASNGQAALERLRAGPAPALLIVDLLMPVLSGWELCCAMSRDPRWADLPVVIVSATDEIPGPLPGPAIQVLAKPIPFDRLLAEVERHCR